MDTKDVTKLASMTIFWIMDLTAIFWFAMVNDFWGIIAYHTRFLTAPFYLPWQIVNQIRIWTAFKKSWWKLSLKFNKK